MQAAQTRARFGRIVGGRDAVAFGGEKARQQIADARIVVDDEEMRRVVGRVCGGALR